ncbi:hypothetical protein ACLWBD_08250 [Bdellovibrio sp. HCB117]|uniref:hypothetical protein n=1 Tax=Bdellovibrio sp. HCB117 TaxID=3394359 RepID=UPI0039B6B74B
MYRIILLVCFLYTPAFAKNKTVQDFYTESQTLLQKAQSAKTLQEKQSHLKSLEKSLKASLQEYEKENPEEAKGEEKEVSLLESTLEPVFELKDKKSLTPKDCESKKQFIITGDSMGRPEEAPRTKTAQEALRWIDVLCK